MKRLGTFGELHVLGSFRNAGHVRGWGRVRLTKVGQTKRGLVSPG